MPMELPGSKSYQERMKREAAAEAAAKPAKKQADKPATEEKAGE